MARRLAGDVPPGQPVGDVSALPRLLPAARRPLGPPALARRVARADTRPGSCPARRHVGRPPGLPGAYAWIGADVLNAHALLSVVTRRGFAARELWPLAFYFVPVNAVLEELFWRGVVLNELRGLDEAASTFGVAWTAFTFAAWHWLVLRLLLRPGWAELAVLGILAAGVFFSWLYRRTGSIVVPILWHGLVFDLALILIFAAIVRAG